MQERERAFIVNHQKKRKVNYVKAYSDIRGRAYKLKNVNVCVYKRKSIYSDISIANKCGFYIICLKSTSITRHTTHAFTSL